MKDFQDIVDLHLTGFPAPMHDMLRKFAHSLGSDLVKTAEEEMRDRIINFLSLGAQMQTQKGQLAEVSKVRYNNGHDEETGENASAVEEDDHSETEGSVVEDDDEEDNEDEAQTKTEETEEVTSAETSEAPVKKKRGRPPGPSKAKQAATTAEDAPIKKKASVICHNLECKSGRPGVKPFGNFCGVCKEALSDSQKKKKKDEFLKARDAA